MELTIKLTVEETNKVLSILGTQAYNVAAPLIDKIKMQAIPQVAAAESKEAAKDD